VLVILATLSGCGGGGSGGNDPNTATGLGTTIQLSAAPPTVSPGGYTVISWTSDNASSCEASGGWSGAKTTTGSFKSGALSADTTFTLSCNGSMGGALARLTVAVAAVQGTPKVILSSRPGSVAINGTIRLEWSASGSESCQASGDWSGAKSPAGSQVIQGIQRDSSFNLTCTGAGQTALAMTSVVLQRATLRWSAPAANTAGFHVFWGTSTGSKEHTITIRDPGARAQVIDLPSAGLFYFSMAAFDPKGIESARSNEVSKLIPQ
jgi:hypothetical protein